MKYLKIIKSLEKQAINSLMINCYLKIIESHLRDSISNENELKARKYSKLKQIAMNELRGYKNYISLVLHK